MPNQSLAGEWSIAPTWVLSGSYSRARGDSRDEDGTTPLQSIDPAKLVLSLRHEVAGRYGAEATVNAGERKKRAHDDAV